jgi:hypothetical protein
VTRLRGDFWPLEAEKENFDLDSLCPTGGERMGEYEKYF